MHKCQANAYFLFYQYGMFAYLQLGIFDLDQIICGFFALAFNDINF